MSELSPEELVLERSEALEVAEDCINAVRSEVSADTTVTDVYFQAIYAASMGFVGAFRDTPLTHVEKNQIKATENRILDAIENFGNREKTEDSNEAGQFTLELLEDLSTYSEKEEKLGDTDFGFSRLTTQVFEAFRMLFKKEINKTS